MKRTFSTVVGALALFASTDAMALSCQEILDMAKVSVPAEIIVQTMEGSGSTFTADEIRCLVDGDAPSEVVEKARSMGSAAAPANDGRTSGGGTRNDSGSSGFEESETLGGDVSLSGEGDPLEAGGPAIIEQAIEAYRQKKYLSSSKALFDLLEEDAYPNEEAKIQYYLAKSLYDLEMYHGAQHYFMEVVRKGPRNPYFKYALPKLVAIAQINGNDVELLRVVHKIPPEAFPRQAKNHLYYLMGRKLYEKGELSAAAEYFQQISAKSDLYMRSKYYEGVIHNERGKLKSAVKAFRDVYQADPSEAGGMDARDIEDLKDLALINIARIYYSLERFDQAENYYDLVDRNSKYWPESLFERAWTNFMRSDLNLSLGLLLTVDSPYFADEEFVPEATILRGLTFFQLCEYQDVESILIRFEDEHRPMRKEIKAFLTEFEGEAAADLADQAFDAYFGPTPRDTKLTKAFFAKVLRNRDLGGLVRHMDMMDREIEMIDAEKAIWRDSLGASMKEEIEKDRARYKKKAGQALLVELAKQYTYLGDLLGQSEIIRFEVVDAQRLDYAYKAAAPDVDAFDTKPVDFAVSKEIIYWPFNGEFWRDELGYYRYAEHGSCN
ncbi:MAG: tetratricopeptide repeat protein [Deltaproteobacteria bacterium]|nr:MAG: tetratricopeptide repeat protein [Deltaproteobacteria bacterium]